MSFRLGPAQHVLLLLVLLSVQACVSVPQPPDSPVAPPPASSVRVPATIRVRVAGTIRAVPFEDYVLGSALSEVSPVGDSANAVDRIFQVQTVLARTYALSNLGRHRAEGFDLCDSTHCQLYQPQRVGPSRFTLAARRAAAATAGRVLMFRARPARATFHADCGGHTASADSVWTGTPLAYLIGGPDDAPLVSHRAWQFTTSAEALGRAVDVGAGARSGRSPSAIRVVERDASGRADTVEIVGRSTRRLTGEEFRSALNAAFGPTAIRSTRFDVAAVGSSYRFEGTGYGHGVGLCQVGAAARARAGEPLERILAAYFPGTTLSAF